MALRDERLTDAAERTGRRPSRRLPYSIAAAAAAAGLLVAALIVGLVVGRSRHAGGTAGQPGQPPALPAPAGIVTVASHAGAGGFVLAFHDPTTGRVVRTANATPPGVSGAGMRERFNRDLTMFAWATGDAVHVARLTPTGYAETASWTADLGTTWDDAVVNPVTGRVWFRQTRTAGGADGTVERLIQIVSLDPTVAKDTPRVEQVQDLPQAFDPTGAPTHEQTVPLDSDPKVTIDLAITDTRLLNATVAPSSLIPGVRSGAVQYECPAASGPDTLICYAPPTSAVQFGTPYGAIAELRFDRAAQRATLRKLLPDLGLVSVQGLLISPDHTQLRLWTERGWMSTTLPTIGTPQPVKMEQPADAPLAWL